MPALHPRDVVWNSFLDRGREAAPARTDAGEEARVVADVVKTAHDRGGYFLASWKPAQVSSLSRLQPSGPPPTLCRASPWPAARGVPGAGAAVMCRSACLVQAGPAGSAGLKSSLAGGPGDRGGGGVWGGGGGGGRGSRPTRGAGRG